LFSTTTLLEDTLNRLDGLVERDHVLILTNQEQESAVRALAATLPRRISWRNRRSATRRRAIALGAGGIAAGPGATMIVLPADHLIQDRAAFPGDPAYGGGGGAGDGELVTIGIKPTWACPGFGYIEQGGAVEAGEPRGGSRFLTW